MLEFIKRLFVWWNGATLGTLLTTWRRAQFVYEDKFGNRYYEEKRITYDGRKRRWVRYKGYADASRIPADWHGWLHHIYDERPHEGGISHPLYARDHCPNLTGSVFAYMPDNYAQWGAKPSPSYEPWQADKR